MTLRKGDFKISGSALRATHPTPVAPQQAQTFRAALLRWYARHRRELPWRSSSDPYRIWVSEIMLQQTRVGAVLEHYSEFLRRFPNVKRLAAARPAEVLAAWSGLGYYRRARALHQAARLIVHRDQGKLPPNADGLRTLPGIGPYTAAAIASIAFREPCAVVDGNVERVLRRWLGWRTEPAARIWGAAQQLLSRRSPGNFNQAAMELGAVVCLPARPRCHACPVAQHCATRGPLPSAPRATRQSAETTVGLATRDGRVYLARRSQRESLMPGMWELPQVPPDGLRREFTLRHAITVTDHTVHVCRVAPSAVRGGRWISLSRAAGLPLTGLARRILRRTALI